MAPAVQRLNFTHRQQVTWLWLPFQEISAASILPPTPPRLPEAAVSMHFSLYLLHSSPILFLAFCISFLRLCPFLSMSFHTRCLSMENPILVFSNCSITQSTIPPTFLIILLSPRWPALFASPHVLLFESFCSWNRCMCLPALLQKGLRETWSR